VDTSFNRSAASPETATQAETRAIAVTFTVALPESTPATDTIFIAGDFQGWDPAGTPMTKVDDRTWTITVPFTEGDAPQYKYTRGSWEAVEKDAGCGEIPNRTVPVTFGDDGTQLVTDTVEKWRDVDQCG
jgi:pullulanase